MPRQLPADIRGFVDRNAELGTLDELLVRDVAEPTVARLCVIAGTAGVGKTALALRWAHRAQEHFPDGQFYVNLRGYDPGLPVAPGDVLDRFLRALGVTPAGIPGDVDAKASLFRSLVAERRMLLILDNAATVRQVRPLLPGTAGCLAVVTSRSRLSGLVVRDGAQRLPLDLLAESDAIRLLHEVTADYRRADDPVKMVELVRLCARLPLALRIAAERAACRPQMPIDDLVRDLRDESGLWSALSSDGDDDSDAVRTVFAWSYRALTEEAARAFRLLGLHPGPDFSTPAAGALLAIDPGRARQLLDVLAGAHLLEQIRPDRYQFHDLLRSYATDQARHEETAENRYTVLRRVVSWYSHTAQAVQAVVAASEPRVALDPLDAGISPLEFTSIDAANSWYESERANLVAATRAAADAGMHRIACQLPMTLRAIYMDRNPFEDWFTTGHIGLTAARQVGDRNSEAELLEGLAMACVQSHQLAQGEEYYRAALDLRRDLGDRFGEVLTLNGIGLLYLRTRKLRRARRAFERGLSLLQRLDVSRYWVAILRGNLGEVLLELEYFAPATECVREALDTFRDLGERAGEGNALRLVSVIARESDRPAEASEAVDAALAIAREMQSRALVAYWMLESGRVHQALGDLPKALASYQHAAGLQRRIGDRSREAETLTCTGDVYCLLGRHNEAADFYRVAATIYRELVDPWGLAISLDGLSTALDRQGATVEADGCRGEILRALRDFEDPKAIRLRARTTDRSGTG